MTQRSIYVGIGECDCGTRDTRLYFVPGSGLVHTRRAVCDRCALARGFTVPTPRAVEGLQEASVVDPKLDLGHGHFFEVVIGNDEKLVGWLHTHRDARGGDTPCQSFCAVRPLNGTPVHQVVCAEPLTLTPSLLCRACGVHGNVVNGKWEPL